jgi:ribosomal protein L7/L12
MSIKCTNIKCGHINADENSYCVKCGKLLSGVSEKAIVNKSDFDNLNNEIRGLEREKKQSVDRIKTLLMIDKSRVEQIGRLQKKLDDTITPAGFRLIKETDYTYLTNCKEELLRLKKDGFAPSGYHLEKDKEQIDLLGPDLRRKSLELYNQKRYSEALPYLQAEANDGLADAQDLLGKMYHNGWGVQKDVFKAAKWYRSSADQGYPQGQVDIGTMFLVGAGVAKIYSEALKWFQKAAAQGNQDAKDRIGYMTANGMVDHHNYDLVLKYVGASKLQVVKAVKETFNLGLKEAKDLVDGAPTILRRGISRTKAERLKRIIEKTGAIVEIR